MNEKKVDLQQEGLHVPVAFSDLSFPPMPSSPLSCPTLHLVVWILTVCQALSRPFPGWSLLAEIWQLIVLPWISVQPQVLPVSLTCLPGRPQADPELLQSSGQTGYPDKSSSLQSIHFPCSQLLCLIQDSDLPQVSNQHTLLQSALASSKVVAWWSLSRPRKQWFGNPPNTNACRPELRSGSWLEGRGHTGRWKEALTPDLPLTHCEGEAP